MSTQPNNYDAGSLWRILIETVHALPMYKHHKRYVERSILPEKPRISAKETALIMGMPLGEAIVIFEELRPSRQERPEVGEPPKTVTAKSLLEYTNG